MLLRAWKVSLQECIDVHAGEDALKYFPLRSHQDRHAHERSASNTTPSRALKVLRDATARAPNDEQFLALFVAYSAQLAWALSQVRQRHAWPHYECRVDTHCLLPANGTTRGVAYAARQCEGDCSFSRT